MMMFLSMTEEEADIILKRIEMSTHFPETGYDPDIDYNILVEAHKSAGPPRLSDEERIAMRDLTWARNVIDELADDD